MADKNKIEAPSGMRVEWGVKYIDLDDRIVAEWGFSNDPRLPDSNPSIHEDGTIYIGDDGMEVLAVAHRFVTDHEWEQYGE